MQAATKAAKAVPISSGEHAAIAEQALKTALERGLTLFTNGYTIDIYSDRPGVYSVARPDNDPRPLRPGESLWNDVDVCHQDCTCECFHWRGGCKHLVAVNRAVAEAVRLMAPMLQAVSERSSYGTLDSIRRPGAGFSQ